jgi:hypothetical protein
MSGDFTCAQCGGVFEKAWTDEEAIAEAHETYTTGELDEGTEVVCGDCYRRVMSVLPVDVWRATRTE